MKSLFHFRIMMLIAALAIQTAFTAVHADGPDPIPLTPLV